MSLEEAKKWLEKSTKVVGFSGAGISTASGIPDFRSPGGVWSKNRTVLYQEFLANEEDRIEYWRQKVAIWPEMRHAKANRGHEAFFHLHEQNKLLGMITQNIEGLHQESGLPDDLVIELHGTTRIVTCLTCNDQISMDEACKRVQEGELAPKCQKNKCGGYLKPATVSFGQSLGAEAIRKASQLCEECEVFIAVGSSLVVHPAAGFPVLAKQAGAKLIIVNREETPLDGIADGVFHDEIVDILPQLVGMGCTAKNLA